MNRTRHGRAAAAALALTLTIVAASCRQTPEPPPGSVQVSVPGPAGASLDAVELGDGSRVAVLSHGATGTKEGFYPLLEALADAGWRAIAYDARGVGSSTGNRGAGRDADLAAVVAYARETGARRIALVGASQGAAVSLDAAAALEAAAVVALSAPGPVQGGRPRVSGRPVPVLPVAARDDGAYPAEAAALAGQVGTDAVIVDGDGHGTGMFADDPGLLDRIVAFLDAEAAADAGAGS